MAPDSAEKKQHIKAALAEQDSRVAAHIMEMGRTLCDLIDDLSPTVLEALKDVHEEREAHSPRTSAPKGIQSRSGKIPERAYHEAQKRERQLYHGLTGEDEPQ
jgi:hypothetical protein